MSETVKIYGTTKEEKYKSLLPQLKALVEDETDAIASISNIVAALKFTMDNFFWVGVYFVKQRQANTTKELVLGPFQGSIACTRIAYGKGVCGTAWETRQTVIVDDVDSFPGHIACSSLSKSEIVVPVIKNGEVVLVLDIDSQVTADFDTTDKQYLEEIGTIIATLY